MSDLLAGIGVLLFFTGLVCIPMSIIVIIVASIQRKKPVIGVRMLILGGASMFLSFVLCSSSNFSL